MTDTETQETQEYELKKVGIGLHDGVQETLIVRNEDGRDEFKPGDKLELTSDQAKELRKIGVSLSKSDGSDDEEDSEESQTEPENPADEDAQAPGTPQFP